MILLREIRDLEFSINAPITVELRRAQTVEDFIFLNLATQFFLDFINVRENNQSITCLLS